MGDEKRKYNLTICPMMKSSSGKSLGWFVNEEVIEALKSVELGGKFMVRLETNARKADAFFEYVSKEDVDAWAEKNKTESDGGL